MVMVPLLQAVVRLLALPVYVLVLLGLWDPFWKKLFPYVMASVSRYYNRKLHQEKQQLFSNLAHFAGSSGSVSLLEIGVGHGANFQFYPFGCRVICTDSNPNVEKYLLKNIAENQHISFEGFILASGEDLHQVPDSSVDVVVGTLVLCSVTNVKAVLKEVLRVLRPGGAFYFMEHVAADRSSWTYFWQQVYDPTWQRLGNGCTLLRESWKDLENENFSKLNLRHIRIPINWNPARAHILGYAIK